MPEFTEQPGMTPTPQVEAELLYGSRMLAVDRELHAACGVCSCCRVVTVSSPSEGPLAPLLDLLAAQGCAQASVERPDDLPSAIDDGDAVVALVYDDGAGGNGRKSLLALRRAGKVAPLIVVAKRPDFGFYYELMCDGAYDCFSIEEGWKVIGQAARWAAVTHAISPGNRSRMEHAAVA